MTIKIARAILEALLVLITAVFISVISRNVIPDILSVYLLLGSLGLGCLWVSRHFPRPWHVTLKTVDYRIIVFTIIGISTPLLASTLQINRHSGEMAFWAPNAILMVALYFLFAAALEEMISRVLIQSALESLLPWILAATIQSALFTALHYTRIDAMTSPLPYITHLFIFSLFTTWSLRIGVGFLAVTAFHAASNLSSALLFGYRDFVPSLINYPISYGILRGDSNPNPLMMNTLLITLFALAFFIHRQHAKSVTAKHHQPSTA